MTHNRTKGMFAEKGSDLLRTSQSPDNMADFLIEANQGKAHLHKSINTQNHKSAVVELQKQCDARLTMEIRQDLYDLLLDHVNRRKKSRTRPATQRAIVELALEDYFQRHGD